MEGIYGSIYISNWYDKPHMKKLDGLRRPSCRICGKPATHFLNVHGSGTGDNRSPLNPQRSWEDACDDHVMELLETMQLGLMVNG